ncbi:hypothetical protein SB748_02830 [Rhizobium sp. SIMBA_035]|jgi:hypothetical protein
MADIIRLNAEIAHHHPSGLKSGGGDGTFDGMEARVTRLEGDMTEMKGDLKSLLKSSAEIKGKIDSLPSAYEFGQLRGRVDSLPTTAKLASLLAVFVAAIALVNNWAAIKAILFP